MSCHNYCIERIVTSERHKTPSVNVDVTAENVPDSSVGTKTRYGLGGLRDRIPVGGEIPFTRPNQLWAHLASCALGTGSLFGS